MYLILSSALSMKEGELIFPEVTLIRQLAETSEVKTGRIWLSWLFC